MHLLAELKHSTKSRISICTVYALVTKETGKEQEKIVMRHPIAGNIQYAAYIILLYRSLFLKQVISLWTGAPKTQREYMEV